MELYNTLIAVWVALFGLTIGSFLNVVIHRLPRKLGVARGRSVCPQCQTQLKWYHNIPLLSYLFLRGRCAFCRASIPLRYPLVEIINAALYLYFFSHYGAGLQLAVTAVLASALLVIFFIDLDHHIIPDVITLPGMLLGLAVSLAPEGIGIVNALIGLVVGGGSLYAMAMLGDWLFKKESMGGGDIKMAAMLGAFVGWQKVILIFISSAVIGLVISIVIMFFSSRLRRTRVIPFGPFLAMAAMVAIVYGDRLISFYLETVLGRS